METPPKLLSRLSNKKSNAASFQISEKQFNPGAGAISYNSGNSPKTPVTVGNLRNSIKQQNRGAPVPIVTVRFDDTVTFAMSRTRLIRSYAMLRTHWDVYLWAWENGDSIEVFYPGKNPNYCMPIRRDPMDDFIRIVDLTYQYADELISAESWPEVERLLFAESSDYHDNIDFKRALRSVSDRRANKNVKLTNFEYSAIGESLRVRNSLLASAEYAFWWGSGRVSPQWKKWVEDGLIELRPVWDRKNREWEKWKAAQTFTGPDGAKYPLLLEPPKLGPGQPTWTTVHVVEGDSKMVITFKMLDAQWTWKGNLGDDPQSASEWTVVSNSETP